MSAASRDTWGRRTTVVVYLTEPLAGSLLVEKESPGTKTTDSFLILCDWCNLLGLWDVSLEDADPDGLIVKERHIGGASGYPEAQGT